MNRRDFLNLTAGSAVAAVAPLPRLAMVAPVMQAPPNLYVWAVAMARAGNPMSTDTLGKALKVSPSQAKAMINKLVTRGVVGAPNALGIARSTNAVVSTAANPVQSGSNPAVDAVKDMLSNRIDSTRETETNSAEIAISPSIDDSVPPEVSDAARSAE